MKEVKVIFQGNGRHIYVIQNASTGTILSLPRGAADQDDGMSMLLFYQQDSASQTAYG